MYGKSFYSVTKTKVIVLETCLYIFFGRRFNGGYILSSAVSIRGPTMEFLKVYEYTNTVTTLLLFAKYDMLYHLLLI